MYLRTSLDNIATRLDATLFDHERKHVKRDIDD